MIETTQAQRSCWDRETARSLGQLKHLESIEQGTRKDRAAWERRDRGMPGCPQGILGPAGIHMHELKPYEMYQEW